MTDIPVFSQYLANTDITNIQVADTDMADNDISSVPIPIYRYRQNILSTIGEKERKPQQKANEYSSIAIFSSIGGENISCWHEL